VFGGSQTWSGAVETNSYSIGARNSCVPNEGERETGVLIDHADVLNVDLDDFV